MTEAEQDALQVGDTIKYINSPEYPEKDLYWEILFFPTDRTTLVIKSVKTNSVNKHYSSSFLLKYWEVYKRTDINGIPEWHPIARLQKMLGEA